jgi:hypothetical protein
VLEQRGVQFASAFGLAFPLPEPLEDDPHRYPSLEDDPIEDEDEDEDEDAAEERAARYGFEELVRIATNDPRTGDIDLGSQGGPCSYAWKDINALLACLADALQGNTFLHHVSFGLTNQQYKWAHLKKAVFERLLEAVRQSSLTNFYLPGTSFFDNPEGYNPEANNPGKYSLAAADRVIEMGRAVALNSIRMVETNLPYFCHRDVRYWEFGEFGADASTQITLVYVDGDILAALAEALSANSRLRYIHFRNQMGCPLIITDETVAPLEAKLSQCSVVEMDIATLAPRYHSCPDDDRRPHPRGDCFDHGAVHSMFSGERGDLSAGLRASLMRQCIANLVTLVKDNDPSVTKIEWRQEWMLHKGIDLESVRALAEALPGNTHLQSITCGMNMCPALCEAVDWSARTTTADPTFVFATDPTWPHAFDISGRRVLNFRSHAVSCALSETGTVHECEGYYRVMDEPVELLRAAVALCNVTLCSIWTDPYGGPERKSRAGDENPMYQGVSEEPVRQTELDEICNLNKQRLEFYRPHQRLLLRVLHERPMTPGATPSGGTGGHRALVGLDLSFSADLFELVCSQLDRCLIAPTSPPETLPEFPWGRVDSPQPPPAKRAKRNVGAK